MSKAVETVAEEEIGRSRRVIKWLVALAAAAMAMVVIDRALGQDGIAGRVLGSLNQDAFPEIDRVDHMEVDVYWSSQSKDVPAERREEFLKLLRSRTWATTRVPSFKLGEIRITSHGAFHKIELFQDCWKITEGLPKQNLRVTYWRVDPETDRKLCDLVSSLWR